MAINYNMKKEEILSLLQARHISDTINYNMKKEEIIVQLNKIITMFKRVL